MSEAKEQAARTPAIGDAPKRVSFESILSLLRSGKDEEKFVGLLLLTKTGSSDDLNLLKAAREAVGLAFIDRLTRTEGYRTLALSMLATFSADPLFASSDALLSRVRKEPPVSENAPHDVQLPLILSLLCTPSADPAEVADAHRCVMAVVAAQAPAVASAGLLVPLAKAAATVTGDRQLDLLNAVMAVCYVASPSPPNPSLDGAVRVIFPAVIPLLARRDAGAFVALQALATLLDALSPEECKSVSQSLPAPLMDETSTALLALLSSKLGASQRALALLVVAHCAGAWGLCWAGAKLGPLSAQLARAELEVALQYSTSAAPPAERARVVTSCVHLLETMLDLLMEAAGSDLPQTGVTPEMLLSYRAPLDEAASTILSYFETAPSDPPQFQLTVLRPLAAWLAELDELPAGFEPAIPALLALPDDVIPHLLPAFTVAASTPTLTTALITQNLPQRLVAFLAPQFAALVSAAKRSLPAQRALAGACACIAALAKAGTAHMFVSLYPSLESAAEQLSGTDAGYEAVSAVDALRAALPHSLASA